jgi:hypothetical protein
LRQIYLCKKNKKKYKAKVHPPDRIKKKNSKRNTALEVKTSSFIRVNRVQMLVLLLPHVRWREFFAWDGQIGPVIWGREAPLTTSW